MAKASEAILSLHPVTFRYKVELVPLAFRSLDLWPSRSRKSVPICRA